MRKARSMEFAAPKGKFLPKASSSSKDSRSFPKKVENLDSEKKSTVPQDQETLNDLRRKRLCFYCKGPYDEKHDCPLRPNAKTKQMEWFYADEHQFDNSDQQTDHEDSRAEKSENEAENEQELKLREAHLSSMQREGSFRMRGLLSGQRVVTLLDIGATYNFIDASLVAKHGIQTEEFEGIRVKVADEYTLKRDRMISDLPMHLNNFDFKEDFYV